MLDYFTFVPCGESTLDVNLGETIDLIRLLGKKIAVFTNGSLLKDDRVKQDLIKADYVSLKVDTIDEQDWHKINKPGRIHVLAEILSAINEFSKFYTGLLVAETKLIKDINTDENKIREIGDFLKMLNPHVAYLSVPLRPPAEKWTQNLSIVTMRQCYRIMIYQLKKVAYLKQHEGIDAI